MNRGKQPNSEFFLIPTSEENDRLAHNVLQIYLILFHIFSQYVRKYVEEERADAIIKQFRNQ